MRQRRARGAVAASFREAGHRSVAVSGKSAAAERDAAMSGLEDGRVQVLCACDLICEGLDVPNVAAVILLRPTQSLRLHVQQVGRGLRPAAGKNRLVILDHAGSTKLHGLPDHVHEWSLNGRVKRAKSSIRVVRCAECYAMHGAGTCPECGHDPVAAEAKRARELKVVAGELVEVRDGMAAWRGMTADRMAARAAKAAAEVAAAEARRPH